METDLINILKEINDNLKRIGDQLEYMNINGVFLSGEESNDN